MCHAFRGATQARVSIISTYPERSPQRFDISLVHFAGARQGGTKHGMIVLVDALFDEVWRLVLKLLVG